jgi:anaerobic selenocysteine-containing dehydrogenase
MPDGRCPIAAVRKTHDVWRMAHGAWRMAHGAYHPRMPIVLGTCHHDCPDSCGWVATVEEGVAVRLRGNPDHPYSRGELCPKVNRFLDRVYSPDRLLTPMLRTGPKGRGELRPASWDEALALVAERVSAAIERHGGETVLPWGDAGTQGLIQMSSLDRRFFARLGASRQTGSLCGATAGAGVAATYGSGRGADPADLRHARYVILWGTNTRLTNRHLWPFVEQAREAGAKIVVIDPLRTITAEEADWFIQPRPGTDVALMLAMMHVIISEDLVDSDYVDRYATGFHLLAEHVTAWTPERAEAATGVPADDIRLLAREYAGTRPSFIRTLIGAEHHENGAMFFRALACLPVLTGAWRDLGGGLARSVGVWSEVNVDDSVFNPAESVVRRGISMNELGRALTGDLDPPVSVLFVWNGNPAVTVPNSHLVRSGLQRDDLFTVVSEQFLTDTARFADVVFPATTQLEQLDVVASWGHLYLGWNEPAILPRGESVPNTELWRRLAAAFGMEGDDLYQSDEELMTSALVGVDVAALRARGFVRLDLPDRLTPYVEGGFDTAGGKAELWSQALEQAGLPGLPDYREPPAGGLPLVLLTPKRHTRFLNSSYAVLPGHAGPEGGPFLEIHPEDAASRNIEDDTLVEVHNDGGCLRLRARLTDRVPVGVVAAPFGWQAADHGGDGVANSLTPDTPTDWGGGVAYSDARVEVTAVPRDVPATLAGATTG